MTGASEALGQHVMMRLRRVNKAICEGDPSRDGLWIGDVDYDARPQRVVPPLVALEAGKIYLQETWLAYVWSLGYAMGVIYDEGVQKPLLNGSYTGTVAYGSDILVRARKRFSRGLALLDDYADWDGRLPGPFSKHYGHPESLPGQEATWAGRTTDLMVQAVLFRLFHEHYHLKHPTSSCELGCELILRDDDWYRTYVGFERKADAYALRMLTADAAGEADRAQIGEAVILAFCASLFATKRPERVSHRSHPDMAARLAAVLETLGLDGLHSAFYFWHLACVMMRLFLLKHEYAYPPDVRGADNPQALFADHLSFLDQICHGASYPGTAESFGLEQSSSSLES